MISLSWCGRHIYHPDFQYSYSIKRVWDPRWRRRFGMMIWLMFPTALALPGISSASPTAVAAIGSRL